MAWRPFRKGPVSFLQVKRDCISVCMEREEEEERAGGGKREREERSVQKQEGRMGEGERE